MERNENRGGMNEMNEGGPRGKGRVVGLEGSHAVSEAVKMANTDVIAAYPITPQTHIVERLAEMVADGELDAEFICVESEHSAMSACIGASAAGARTFTCTSAQGLELMHEVLYVASGMRFPVVMVVMNRALSAPLSIWCDHSDAMAVRDVSWIQMFAENNQEAFDLTVCAFRIAENRNVLFPAMIHMDGFYLSHVIEDLVIPDEEEVRDFIPDYEYPFPLDPERPVSMGCFAPPYIYPEIKKAQEVAFERSKTEVKSVLHEFGEVFGRSYELIESYRMDDASIAMLMMGSISETAMLAVDELRDDGCDVGLLRIRLWRPFPFEELRAAVRDIDTLIVVDRCVSYGMGGPVCAEIKSALYDEPRRPKIVSFIAGIGGRDVTVDHFKQMFMQGIERAKSEKTKTDEFVMFGVRE